MNAKMFTAICAVLAATVASAATAYLTVNLTGRLEGDHIVMMSAFGAGLSWGTALLRMHNCNVLPVIEY